MIRRREAREGVIARLCRAVGTLWEGLIEDRALAGLLGEPATRRLLGRGARDLASAAREAEAALAAAERTGGEAPPKTAGPDAAGAELRRPPYRQRLS